MLKAYTIRNRFTNETILEAEAESLKALVESQVRVGANLTGADFSSCQRTELIGIRLDNATIEGADFSGISLKGATFIGSNLSGSLFVESDLTNADFSRANLSACDLSGARLGGTVFTDAQTTGAKIPPRFHRIGSLIAFVTPLVMLAILGIGAIVGILGLVRMIWNALSP